MAFCITGLDPAPFRPLFALGDAQLAERGIVAVEADDDDYPCRVALAGAQRGDRLLLLNHLHQPAATPYRASHAIYVAQRSTERATYRDRLPRVLRERVLAIRAYDRQDMMIDAELVDGREAGAVIDRLLADRRTAYLHAHFAKRGCFAARIDRA